MAGLRIVVAEDFEGFRKLLTATLQERLEIEQIWEVRDGISAVQRAAEVRPDLVVLDIGLPELNGIEAARQILRLSPESKILFVTAVASCDALEEALRIGAHGYVVKVDLAQELLVAVDTVLRSIRFVSSSLGGCPTAEEFGSPGRSFERIVSTDFETTRHELVFYSDEQV